MSEQPDLVSRAPDWIWKIAGAIFLLTSSISLSIGNLSPHLMPIVKFYSECNSTEIIVNEELKKRFEALESMAHPEVKK